MTTAIDLIAELRARDIRLWFEDGKLRYSAPPGALDDELRALLVAQKASLTAILAATTESRPPIQAGPRTESDPLSFSQQRMWVMNQILPESGSAAYSLCGRVVLQGALDANVPVALGRALTELVHRHEALRTVIGLREDKPMARLLPALPVVLTEEVLPAGSDIAALAAAEAAQRFDLTSGPLLRARFVRESPTRAHLLLAVHHICADGWSLGILYRELCALYGAYSTGTDPALPPPPVQYGDYARWQRRQLTVDALPRQAAYWRERLTGLPELLELPADRPRTAAQSYRGAVEPYHLPAELVTRMHRLATRIDGTPFMVALAAWVLVLSRISGGTDIAIGTPVAGRPRAEVEGLIGSFINMLVLRTELSGTDTFLDLLQQTRTRTLEAFDHQHLPFEQVVDLVNPGRSLSHSPLFQHMFILQNAPEAALELPGLSVQLHEVHTGTAKFDTTLIAEEHPDGWRGVLEYATDLFDAATAQRWLGHWRTVLEQVTANPAAELARIPLLDRAELGRILRDWNDTARPVPEVAAHTLIEEQARRERDRCAVIFGEHSWTYGEIDSAADGLAAHLMTVGVRPGALVALLLPRTPEMVVALLAVLKTGAAYLPLDPAAPALRNQTIIDDARPAVVLTTRAAADRDWPEGTVVVVLDEAENFGPAAEFTPPAVVPATAAYVIYTSGSTGLPKGVVVEHRNLVNFFTAMNDLLGASGSGTWLALTTVSFDIAMLELLWTLSTGSTVVLQPDAGPVDDRRPGRVAELGLFYFAAAASEERSAQTYRLLLDSAVFADRHGFSAIWTPERHFHTFGGIYPNPAVTGAAIAAVTERIAIRAGSVVLPLHDPIRVVEEWSVVDNLSGGRVGISVASGWQANDFVLAPQQYPDRKRVMLSALDTVRALWRGESIDRVNGTGESVAVRTLPRPIQPELPVWVTAAGSVETFRAAGAAGSNVLTHLLGQDLSQLAEKIEEYRGARAAAGHSGPGTVSLMVHTFVGTESDAVRAQVRDPFRAYLATSLDLIGNLARTLGMGDDLAALPAADLEALLDHAFHRFYDTAAAFGTVAEVAAQLDRIADAGVDEIACLIDFGLPDALVLESLPLLDAARELHAQRNSGAPVSVPESIRQHGVTRMQCTPSQLEMTLAEPGGADALSSLEILLVGGEALPDALAARVRERTGARIQNMYGPTETTIWSTSHRVDRDGSTFIGRPLANTAVYVLDKLVAPVPAGVAGELYIGGDGVARGYLDRPDLTQQRFVPDPFAARPGARMYRTGDLVRFRGDGTLEFLGRTDHQVKVRGFRIELGDVEAAIGACPGVAQAAATVIGTGVERQLAAYFTVRPGGTASVAEIRSQLSARLPRYMLPGYLAELPTLPYTPNGKIDRKALPQPTFDAAGGAEHVAPRGLTEMRLAVLWERLLDRHSIGIRDSFFELGGNSVLAVMMLAEIEREFGRRLTLSAVFQEPTIAGLAGLLHRTDTTERQALVRLRPGGDVPVFLLPGAGGNLVYFHEMVTRLPKHLAVFGLQPVFTGDGALEELVGTLADGYLPLIVDTAPKGPYHLIGHSFGGHVAIELATRLRARGGAIGLVGLLDTAAPLRERQQHFAQWRQSQWLGTLIRVFERIFQRAIPFDVDQLDTIPEAEQITRLRLALDETGVLPPELNDDVQLAGFVRTYIADQLSAYTPAQPYDGELTFFRAADLHQDNVPPPELAWLLDDPARGWERFCSGTVVVREVAGDHLTMLTAPHVDDLVGVVSGLITPAGS